MLSGSPLSYIGTQFNEDALAFKENDYKGEFSSDIYHFNFGKHSGKFMIDFDGSVIVLEMTEVIIRWIYPDIR